MELEELQRRLSELGRDVLQNFVLDLYLHVPELADRIETLVLYNEPAALRKAIAKRIQAVKRGRRFIDYRDSFSFAQDLEMIIADIEAGLLDCSPKDAFALADQFLASAEAVLNRVDDSGGAVADVYRAAVLIWLKAAAHCDDSGIDWVERVYQLYGSNDYGVLDPLLPNSHILLDRDQLTQLAWRYESETRKAMKAQAADGGLNWPALKSGVALGMVAEALKDPLLYERSVLIQSPKPNDLQKKSIVAMYLRFNRNDEALRWLTSTWQARFEADRLRLLEQAYSQSGDRARLSQVCYRIYLREQSYASFERYLETLDDDDEKNAARLEAIRAAEHGNDVVVSANLLLQLGEADRAQALVLSRHRQLADAFYDSLAKLAKHLEQADCLLAATACYRALLLDILNQARSKAYAHAARYYGKLEAMADRINDYAPLDSHQAFVSRLEQDHGRKRSFWAKLKPNTRG
jgi:hypothetical protein